MARRPRLAAQAAQASMRTPIPNLSDNEDEEMPDTNRMDPATPQEDEEEVENEDEENNEAEDVPSPTRDPEQPSRSATPRRGRPARRRGRRGGRGGRTPRDTGRPTSDDGDNDPASETATPKRRGGFRGHRGGRWAKYRAGGSRPQQAPLDDDGNPMEIVNDEVFLPEDLEGEEKVDKRGYLLDGREYRVRTFTILGREGRLYMLSTEPARCIGFRDSYLFFQKHKHLYKIIIDEEEKKDLIERDLIPHSYKGRAIGVVTARSVFREFGCKIVIGGKKVTDDYQAQAARARGDIEGELYAPDDHIPGPGETYNRNQYVAWHGASAVYHTNAPNVPLPLAKAQDAKRRKILVTSDNWMLEHARETSRFNSQLAAARRENREGIYDIHTNVMQFPANMQPTHARWEVVNEQQLESQDVNRTEGLPYLDPIYGRNFRIHDLCLESTPESWFARANSDNQNGGLSSIPPSILDELPEDCLSAFEEARARESAWQGKWHTEQQDGLRARMLPSFEWFPK